ncbi:unnamed protein product [Durusdinium trenchii]|uniref:Uncharacterized protein n=2 Tax=Durusdinium trenchii TaxID=1381693 RepID=A0ABP0N9P2_9DINO
MTGVSIRTAAQAFALVALAAAGRGFLQLAPRNSLVPRVPVRELPQVVPAELPSSTEPSRAATSGSRVQRWLAGAARVGAVVSTAVISALPRRSRQDRHARPLRGMAGGLAATMAANWKAFSRTDACLMLRLSTLNFCKIYMAMLVLRITIMWFPNINPYRQPFYSMIQLTDPYLNLFRGWMPPIFGIDLSVILAFVVIQAVIDGLTISPFG